MGKLEEQTTKRKRKENIQRAVLGVIAVSGVIAVTAVALPLLAGFAGVAKQAGYRVRYRTATALDRLAKRGLIRFVKRKGVRYVEITEKGKHTLDLEKEKAALSVRSTRRWDRKYRIVMFDIPHYRRKDRDHIRNTLRACGFLRIQDSVWLYPYDCEDLIMLLKSDAHVGKDLLYVIAESIENDRWVKNHFGLS